MLKAIARRTLADEVLSELRRYVVTNDLKPGDRLPTEAELCSELNVGRSTVREAFKYLQAIGVVGRHPRRGTVLQPVSFTRLADLSRYFLLNGPDDLVDLFVARRALELAVLPVAARYATEQDYEQMEKACRLAEADINAGGIGVDGDIAYHRALVMATGNKFLIQFGALIQEFLSEVRTRVHTTEERVRGGVAMHRNIIECLRSGNVEEAQRVMSEHLDVHMETTFHAGQE